MNPAASLLDHELPAGDADDVALHDVEHPEHVEDEAAGAGGRGLELGDELVVEPERRRDDQPEEGPRRQEGTHQSAAPEPVSDGCQHRQCGHGSQRRGEKQDGDRQQGPGDRDQEGDPPWRAGDEGPKPSAGRHDEDRGAERHDGEELVVRAIPEMVGVDREQRQDREDQETRRSEHRPREP